MNRTALFLAIALASTNAVAWKTEATIKAEANTKRTQVQTDKTDLDSKAVHLGGTTNSVTLKADAVKIKTDAPSKSITVSGSTATAANIYQKQNVADSITAGSSGLDRMVSTHASIHALPVGHKFETAAVTGEVAGQGMTDNDTTKATTLASLATTSFGVKLSVLPKTTGAGKLYSGSQNDTLEGGGGNDEMEAAGGNDSITGGGGADEISGDTGNDTINGGQGGDMIYGGAGTDTITTGSTDGTADEAYGGTENDTITGGNGNDVLSGQGGIDSVEGGAGNDAIYIDVIGDVVTDSAGTEWVYCVGTGGPGTFTLSVGIENFENQCTSTFTAVGNALANTMRNINTSIAVTMKGGDGNDSITSSSANDTLEGGNGADTLTGAGGTLDTALYPLNTKASCTINIPSVTCGGVTDTLNTMEKIQFSDVTCTISGTACI